MRLSPLACLGLALACVRPEPALDSGTGAGTGSSTSTGSSEGSSSESETGTPDELPPTPTLASPVDGATQVPLETSLCWNPVEDPEGEEVRYRVFVDDTILSGGILDEEEGHVGPCIGPLLFAHERSYSWRVEAFERDEPERSSAPSELWTFSTIGDGQSEIVFEDDFSADLGWELSGDALTGVWTRGDPVATQDADVRAQPGSCSGPPSCLFTGQNPNAVASEEDVSGGATILTSPVFDLGGAAAASVRLTRFFYSAAQDPSAGLQIELLVPSVDVPGDYEVHPLELLDEDTATSPANAWLPREYAVCGVPMRDGSRLRLTAVDAGAANAGVLEAAIDTVSVHAHDDPSLCAAAPGGHCDPVLGSSACPAELLCCSQGPVNIGVHRCSPPVAGLDYAAPPASPDDPNNGALGCDAADLIIEPEFIEPLFADIFMSDDTCELLEGCVGGTGWRRVMLFSLDTPNIGSADLAVGVPANLPELFHYSECHTHYHFDEFARYELRSGDAVVATGHKQAFCMLDTTSWAWPLVPGKFDCVNQGISRGFSDTYESGLPCQWVDVTNTPPGDYTLHLSVNQPRPDHAVPMLNERDYSNNVIDVPITVP